MAKKQISILLVAGMLSLVLLLTGCVTVKKKTAPAVTPAEKKGIVEKQPIPEASGAASPKDKRITKDVQVFKDLQEIDLDGDGVKEIIAIYSIAENLSGVKVIKISNDKVENIIFKKNFITPDIKFELRENTPVIIVKEKGYFFGLKLSKIYRWDGKSFVAEGQKP